MARLKNISKNLNAFLDMIAVSELTKPLMDITDDGYNVLVGATPGRPLIFHSYAVHPNILNNRIKPASTAAGRYQFLYRYWDYYRKMLKLLDFGPESQDRWAIQYIKEVHALSFIEQGHFDVAITACRSRWASLPGAGYGQRENDLSDLRKAYVDAGGTISVHTA